MDPMKPHPLPVIIMGNVANGSTAGMRATHPDSRLAVQAGRPLRGYGGMGEMHTRLVHDKHRGTDSTADSDKGQMNTGLDWGDIMTHITYSPMMEG